MREGAKYRLIPEEDHHRAQLSSSMAIVTPLVNPLNAKGFLIDLDRTGARKLVGRPEKGSSGGRDFIRTEYRYGAGPVLLENWDLHGSGHAWSGGSTAGSFSDPAAKRIA
jgi:hypothetical protein